VPEILSQQAKTRLLCQKIAEERAKQRRVRQIRKMEDAAWRKKPTGETGTQPKHWDPWAARTLILLLQKVTAASR
jgi:hypothetical protein